jgi:hypothetical protein
MERGTHTLFTWQALTQAKAAAGLTTQQWRDLGDRQKNLWRRRLLSRCGHGGADPDPPFEFGSADLRNVFQLEAIAEFFLNFRDPWLPRDIVERVGNVPRGPLRLPLTPLHGFWIFDGKLVLVETLSAELSLRDAEDVALYIKVFEKMWERATHGEKVAEHINTAVQDLAPHRA